jgi:hypothetical protein
MGSNLYGSGDDVPRIRSYLGSKYCNLGLYVQLQTKERYSCFPAASSPYTLRFNIRLYSNFARQPREPIDKAITYTPQYSANMYGLFSLAIFAFVASTAVAALNDTNEYRLKTELKPHQRNKRLFENLVSEPPIVAKRI